MRPRAPCTTDGLALLGGAALTLAFAPFDVYPLAVLAPAWLLWSWRDAAPRRAAWRGFLFGLGHFGSGVYWIYISLHHYGNAPLSFAVFIALLLIGYMALYPAAMGYLLVRLAPQPGAFRWLVLAPALWTGLEWVRSWLLSGFPWLSLGYSQSDSPLAFFAPVFGVFGVSWALMLSAGLVVMALHRRTALWSLPLAALWLGGWGLQHVRWVEPVAEPLRISLVQGNIDQREKFQPDALERTLLLYARLSREVAADSDVIVWPETAIPVFFEDLDPTFIQAIEEQARRTGTDYLSGVAFGDWGTLTFYNGIVSLGSSRGSYRKRRLVPFGEYLPFRFVLNLFHRFVDIPMADFTSGARQQLLLRAGGHPVGASICFEAVFGSEIRLSLPQARYLVNLSNDAWFGDSLAPHQHLQIARMRALESGRYMARSTNTGISAIIDERGRIIKRSGLFETTVLQGEVQPLRGATPFVRFGDWSILALLALLAMASATIAIANAWPRPKPRWK